MDQASRNRIRKAAEEGRRRAQQRLWSGVMGNPRVAMRTRLEASELLGASQGDFDHEGRNTPVMEAATITKLCGRCSQPFDLSPADQAWWTSRDMSLPRTCTSCRAARRAEREATGHYRKPFSKGERPHGDDI